jgi:hypothetical protein
VVGGRRLGPGGGQRRRGGGTGGVARGWSQRTTRWNWRLREEGEHREVELQARCGRKKPVERSPIA